MKNSFLNMLIPLIRGLSFDGEKGRYIKYEKNPGKILQLKHKIHELSRTGKLLNPPHTIELFIDEESFLEKKDDIIKRLSQDYQQYLKGHKYHPHIIVLDSDMILFSGSTYQECLDTQKEPLTELINVPVPQKSIAKLEYEITSSVKGKIIVVTGGAQGIGACLVRNLVKMGAFLFVADINREGAAKLVEELNYLYNKKCAFAVSVDVTNEQSVQEMTEEIVRNTGGIDVFINNAGVLKAESVKEMNFQDFEFVNKVNYFGYFLCTKYASRVMAWQNKGHPDYITDIIQINSKSGLEGSYKNCAYAGSKFAGIGLTQSFAKELLEDNIKVNAICPGNFFEGPLWSDPQNGLFVQYLKSGKVPRARNIDDVRRFYESKIPLGRGCSCEDIVKAVLYVIGQKYETGQAIPVAGGQVLLR
ncbi:MAG: SDR family NAD(P)-dependent oxidoreductase [Atribacterota bacterium]|nr:SDR family NAD(P)-dependent oxidoreductase [Atribacterota bacterium]